jgi:lysophospholipase L1-like esterase
MSHLIFLVASGVAAAAGDDGVTIAVIGDATAAGPHGWGPALAERFDDRTAFVQVTDAAGRLDTLSEPLDALLKTRPDFVLIQCGQEDQKAYGPAEYRRRLDDFVGRVIAAGAKPVLVGPATRRRFGADGRIEPLADGVHATLDRYDRAASAVAVRRVVMFLNMYRITVGHHNRLGPTASAAYNLNGTDPSLFSPAGAAATADLLLMELRVDHPELAPRVKRD